MQYAEKKGGSDPKALKDAALIEQASREAEPNICQYILKNVTQGVPYEYMDVPCGRRQFYEQRRKFFYLLSKKKG